MSFNVKHYDGDLNENPNKKDDTATPKDMAISVQKLTLGNVLTQPQRMLLVTWMRNNTTGYKRIRAGTPIGWVVAEKTGGGLYPLNLPHLQN
jgi:beta-lactamase class A